MGAAAGFGGWCLAAGSWSLVFGCWLLAANALIINSLLIILVQKPNEDYTVSYCVIESWRSRLDYSSPGTEVVFPQDAADILGAELEAAG